MNQEIDEGIQRFENLMKDSFEKLKEMIIKMSNHEETVYCSTNGCLESAFIGLCTQHYNEIIQKNIQEEKVYEDHIMEPIA